MDKNKITQLEEKPAIYEANSALKVQYAENDALIDLDNDNSEEVDPEGENDLEREE